MKVFKVTEEMNFYEESDFVGSRLTQEEESKKWRDLVGDLQNITPLLWVEPPMEGVRSEDMKFKYDDLYIQTWGDGYELSEPSLQVTFYREYETEFNEPVKYSEWISKEIDRMQKDLKNHFESEGKFEFESQECYQCIDSGGILVGFDAWLNPTDDNEDGEAKFFAIVGMATPYEGSLLSNNGQWITGIELVDLDKAIKDRTGQSGDSVDPMMWLHGGGIGELNPNKYYFYEGGVYNRRRNAKARSYGPRGSEGPNPLEIRLD